MRGLKEDSTKIYVLSLLSKYPQKEVCELTGIAQSTISDFTQKLTHKGWWERFDKLSSGEYFTEEPPFVLEEGETGQEDTLLVHTLGASTLANATKFSHNSIQGHHHSIQGVERYADKGKLRWSMTVGCLLDPHSPAATYASRAVLKRPILGCGMLLGGRGNILLISDLHLPYQHEDAFEFLRALDEVYKFISVLNVGDLYDHHRGSYHESEPNAYGEEEEYHLAKEYAKELQAIFPDMVIVEGNHDAIPQRKLRTIGLPMSMLKDYNKMYDTKPTWVWKKEHWFDSLGGFPVVHPMVLDRDGRWDKSLMAGY